MTPRQVQLVQQSLTRLEPIAGQAAELFYARLFEIDPSLRGLFTGDLKRQGMMLMRMIGSAVRGLSNVDSILPVLRDLGRRHTTYGVEKAHYAIVGQALLWTLERGFGKDFTPELGEAWLAAYAAVASMMQHGRDGQAHAAS